MTDPNIESIKRFNQAAAEWDAKPRRVKLARAIVAAIRKHVPLNKTMKVMDYGTGTGIVALDLQPFVGEVVAVDTAVGMLEVLSGKIREQGIAGVSTRLGDLLKDEFGPAEFDMVVIAMTLHHIQRMHEFLSRLRGVLKPGGWVVIADLDPDDGLFHRDPEGVVHNGFNRSSLCDQFRSVGFTAVRTFDAYTVTKSGADGDVRDFSIFLLTARRVGNQ